MITIEEAKNALDLIIEKSRVHLYKPIQVAEILYRDRVYKDIDLSNLEDYRTQSKKWRDAVTIPLVGRKCTSSARFQDDLFNENATPPSVLVVLGRENRRTNGAVEAYIYNKFTNRHLQLSNALDYCLNSSKESFYVKKFIDSFWNEAGLKRSLDKVYEIIVYALFSTLVEALNLKVEITVNEEMFPLLKEFKRKKLVDILERNVDDKYYVKERIKESRLMRLKDPCYPKPYISHENMAGSITPHPYSSCLRAGASANYILINDERRPTEREMLRLQGFPDSFKIVVSYGKMRHQIGNSVAVPVISAVAKQMIHSLKQYESNK